MTNSEIAEAINKAMDAAADRTEKDILMLLRAFAKKLRKGADKTNTMLEAQCQRYAAEQIEFIADTIENPPSDEEVERMVREAGEYGG